MKRCCLSTATARKRRLENPTLFSVFGGWGAACIIRHQWKRKVGHFAHSREVNHDVLLHPSKLNLLLGGGAARAPPGYCRMTVRGAVWCTHTHSETPVCMKLIKGRFCCKSSKTIHENTLSKCLERLLQREADRSYRSHTSCFDTENNEGKIRNVQFLTRLSDNRRSQLTCRDTMNLLN